LLQKIANKMNAKKIQNILENETPPEIGNIAAFMDYTKSQSFAEIKSAIRAVQSNDFSNVHQFVEILAEDKTKSQKLRDILNVIVAHKQLQRFKMLIFANSARLTVLSKMLTAHYKFPIFQVSLDFGGQIMAQIVKTFRHGVLLIESEAFDILQQTTTFGWCQLYFSSFSKKSFSYLFCRHEQREFLSNVRFYGEKLCRRHFKIATGYGQLFHCVSDS
jgi:hypothetical protein